MGDKTYLSKDESNALLKEANSSRDRAILLLFFNAGLLLNEIIGLTVKSIDWDKRVLHIIGLRNRDIKIDGQLFDALAQWSKERIDVKSDYFFIPAKGKIKKLSPNTIDKLLRKCARRAGILVPVNAQMLRTTFAVKLFSENISVSEASAILGIKDSEALNRYIKLAEIPQPQIPKHIDSRSKISRAASRIFKVKPKTVKPQALPAAKPEVENIILGRDSILAEIKSSISSGKSSILLGELGVGKTHILKHINRLYPGSIYFESPVPVKPMLVKIYTLIYPKSKQKINSRTPASELINLILRNRPDAASGQVPIIIIDNIDRIRFSDADMMAKLLESFIVVASAQEYSEKLKALWLKFKQVKVSPLTSGASKELIKHLAQNISIADYEMFETRILSISNGLPLVIVDSIHGLNENNLISKQGIREIFSDAGTRYRDWTLTAILFWGIALGLRYLALGTNSHEGYILAGFGIAAMSVVRFFALKMR